MMLQKSLFGNSKNCLLLTVLCLWTGVTFAIGNIDIEGKINRDASVGRFDLTITVEGSSQGIANMASESDITKDRLQIYLKEANANDPLGYEGDTPKADLPYTFVKISDPTESTPTSANLKTITFKVRIEHDGSDIKPLDTLVNSDTTGKYITIKVRYKEDGKLLSSESGYEEKVYVSSAIIKGAPEGFQVKSTHQTIKLSWSAASSAKYNDDTTGSISNIVFVAIAEDATADLSNLPAQVWTTDAGVTVDPDAPANSCSFSIASQSVTCSDVTKHYLDTEALKTLSAQGVYVDVADSSKGVSSFTQMVNGKNYYVFAYYEPGGLERTAVLTATPQENKTGAEIAGEGDAQWDLPRCFIATAAYGSPLHKNLKLFIWFRDHVLMNFSLGRSFVDWYYENSPAAAKIIVQYPVLAATVRGMLWVPAAAISTWFVLRDQPTYILLFGFIVSTLGVFLFARYCLRRSQLEH